MDEETKALQEIAKATGQALGSIEKVGQFFARIMGESIDATCGMLADSLKFKRWERQISLVEKAEKLIKAKNLRSRAIPISPKIALSIFHNASLEEDDFLHGLYAKLLVASIDPNTEARRTAFAEILRQMEPIDVKVLQCMYSKFEESEDQATRNWRPLFEDQPLGPRPKEPPTSVPIEKQDLLSKVQADETQYWLSVDNLMRLGLATSHIETGSVAIDTPDYVSEHVISVHGGYDKLSLTTLWQSGVR